MKSGNIVDLSNLDTRDLIEELENRGYMTGLLFNRTDVQTQLDDINKSHSLNLTMTDEQKDVILKDDIPFDVNGSCCEMINDAIYYRVWNLFSQELEEWEEKDLGIKIRNGFGN